MHQDRIGPSSGDLFQQILNLRQLAGKRQRIERDITPHATAVQQLDHLGQFLRPKVVRPGPGIESAIEAKIDRVRSIFDGSPQAIPIARGGEEFK